MNITLDQVRNLFSYDPDTGDLRWAIAQGRMPAGSIAGTINKGYRIVSANREFFKAHRLIWFYVYGEWPKGQIDHINRNRSDNRICNLRDIAQKENLQNVCGPQKNNLTGFAGVTKHQGKWKAQIGVGGTTKYIGMFNSPEEAHLAYLQAKKVHHPGAHLG